MSLYEITFLTREESDPGVRSIIEQAGGTITTEEILGRKRLAYPVKKETQAVYTSYVFDITKAALAEVNRRLGLTTEVLRYLIVIKEIEKVNKEVTKTVREAIAAAEKLEDTVAEVNTEIAADVVVDETPAVEEVTPEVVETVVETVETPEEAPKTEKTEEKTEEKPARKPRAKKAEPENAADATEEDRLKALEDKLGEILKD